MDIHIYHHFAEADLSINKKLTEILGVVKALKKENVIMSQQMDALIVDVHENTSLDDSIVAMLEGLAAQIADTKDDPVKAAALSVEVKAKSEKIRAALLANTPPQA